MFLVRLPFTLILLPFRMLAGVSAVIAFGFRTLLLGLVAFAAVSSGPHGEALLDQRIEEAKAKISSFAVTGYQSLPGGLLDKAKTTLQQSVEWASLYAHSFGAPSDCAKK